ncbi:hypothetical protein JOD25_003359 [Kurthia huakuii]|nr:hypothetical protein [Kurthia huakuii]
MKEEKKKSNVGCCDFILLRMGLLFLWIFFIYTKYFTLSNFKFK